MQLIGFLAPPAAPPEDLGVPSSPASIATLRRQLYFMAKLGVALAAQAQVGDAEAKAAAERRADAVRTFADTQRRTNELDARLDALADVMEANERRADALVAKSRQHEEKRADVVALAGVLHDMHGKHAAAVAERDKLKAEYEAQRAALAAVRASTAAADAARKAADARVEELTRARDHLRARGAKPATWDRDMDAAVAARAAAAARCDAARDAAAAADARTKAALEAAAAAEARRAAAAAATPSPASAQASAASAARAAAAAAREVDASTAAVAAATAAVTAAAAVAAARDAASRACDAAAAEVAELAAAIAAAAAARDADLREAAALAAALALAPHAGARTDSRLVGAGVFMQPLGPLGALAPLASLHSSSGASPPFGALAGQLDAAHDNFTPTGVLLGSLGVEI